MSLGLHEYRMPLPLKGQKLLKNIIILVILAVAHDNETITIHSRH